MHFAHTRNAEGRYHGLADHLQAVAEIARDFAGPFGAAEAAYYAGLWHDLGKFHPDFQAYLERCEASAEARGTGPDHKGAGVRLALTHLGPVALALQGHHGGLRNRSDLEAWLAGPRVKREAVDGALRLAYEAIADLEPGAALQLPSFVRGGTTGELFLRLVFSALVDADYLDTERHFSEGRASRRAQAVSPAVLWEQFQLDQARFQEAQRPIDEIRNAIYEHCVAAASEHPGAFKLSVPTGAGKTRSAMAFALRHAVLHGLRRVVVAVPFISITEQTADTYRKIFAAAGPSAVLEHHSLAMLKEDSDDEQRQEDAQGSAVWSRLAAENWDAPIVVTTTVQLFESLFASGTSACRKLHRLAKSVIVLDEAQALPARLLTPILDVLQELALNYGSTIVFSTATQPAFDSIPAFRSIAPVAIVPEPQQYYAALKRVDYEWLPSTHTWAQIAEIMRDEPQALAVVNTKKHALSLVEELHGAGVEDVIHLSTLLCGAHRREVLRRISSHLDAGERCVVVSTQVIEAGVDLDFPVVLRATAPLDSVIQAAGRCNREAKLGRGRVVVFDPEDGGLPTESSYKVGTAQTKALRQAASLGRALDPDDPAVSALYFRRLLETLGPAGTDRARVQEARAEWDFPETARRFCMIEDAESIVVTKYGTEAQRAEVRRLLSELRDRSAPGRELLRDLQPYVVNAYKHEIERYQREGLLVEVIDSVWEWLGEYDPVNGIVATDVDVLVV
jgi:CRISPR-associated endonuclease/helicase Cas3